jgi:cell pole-organizing protein PopZ
MTAAAGDSPEKDQSMDDILASIRRIMLDEQARLQDSPGASATASGRPSVASPDPVLILDQSMVVEDMPPQPLSVSLAEETVVMVSSENAEALADPGDTDRTLDVRYAIVTETVPADAATADGDIAVAHEPQASAQTTVLGATGRIPADLGMAGQVVISAEAIEALMAPAAAAAAAASVEALLKQLSDERISALLPSPSPSPTIEEIVRAELRPFLKAWLDEHLPPMVERLVRVEITRLIGRSGL